MLLSKILIMLDCFFFFKLNSQVSTIGQNVLITSCGHVKENIIPWLLGVVQSFKDVIFEKCLTLVHYHLMNMG